MSRQWKQLLQSTLAALGAMLIVMAFTTMAHCRTTIRQNGLGALIVDDNPYVYMFGSVVDGTVFRCGKDTTCTNVAFNPHLTSTLHIESVLFCGDVSSAFRGLRGPLVITYRRQASRQANGIGCHDLETVYAVQEVQP